MSLLKRIYKVVKDSGDLVAPESLVKERYDTCKECEEFTFTKNCKKCLCFMPLKTSLAGTKCPKGKW